MYLSLVCSRWLLSPSFFRSAICISRKMSAGYWSISMTGSSTSSSRSLITQSSRLQPARTFSLRWRLTTLCLFFAKTKKSFQTIHPHVILPLPPCLLPLSAPLVLRVSCRLPNLRPAAFEYLHSRLLLLTRPKYLQTPVHTPSLLLLPPLLLRLRALPRLYQLRLRPVVKLLLAC